RRCRELTPRTFRRGNGVSVFELHSRRRTSARHPAGDPRATETRCTFPDDQWLYRQELCALRGRSAGLRSLRAAQWSARRDGRRRRSHAAREPLLRAAGAGGSAVGTSGFQRRAAVLHGLVDLRLDRPRLTRSQPVSPSGFGGREATSAVGGGLNAVQLSVLSAFRNQRFVSAYFRDARAV